MRFERSQPPGTVQTLCRGRVEIDVLTTLAAILSRHAMEASYLWELRCQAVAAPPYKLSELAALDGRVDAHLDGLRIGGQDAWETCVEELRWGEPGEVFPASLLAFESGAQHRIDTVPEAVGQSYERSRPVVAALAWLPGDAAAPHVRRFLGAASPLLRRIAVAAAAAHRHDPGPPLTAAIEDADPMLRGRAIRAVGELGRDDLLGAVRGHLGDEAASCRFAAAWSVALLAGDADAIHTLRQLVEARSEKSPAALQLVLRRTEGQEAKAWLVELAKRGPDSARSAVIGAGVVGDPDLVPWLIETMRKADLARVAGEALAMIAGVDIAYQDLDGPWPEGFTAGPTEDPQDENVAMDPDENLPWPDAKKIAAWWAKHGGDFAPGSRYLLGRPLTEEWLEDVLRHGYQRQRAAAALELAIRRPGQPLFEVRAPGFRQQEWLGLKSAGR